MRRRHSSHSWPTHGARTAVKGARFLRVHRSEAQTLDGCRSKRYALERVRMLIPTRSFAVNKFATSNFGYLVRDPFPQLACFQRVFNEIPRFRGSYVSGVELSTFNPMRKHGAFQGSGWAEDFRAREDGDLKKRSLSNCPPRVI